jgi:hypothetical protein
MPMTDLTYVRGSVDSDALSKCRKAIGAAAERVIYYADVKGLRTDDA